MSHLTKRTEHARTHTNETTLASSILHKGKRVTHSWGERLHIHSCGVNSSSSKQKKHWNYLEILATGEAQRRASGETSENTEPNGRRQRCQRRNP